MPLNLVPMMLKFTGKFLFVMVLLTVSGLWMATPAMAKLCPEAKIALSAGNAFMKAAEAGSTRQFERALSRYVNMRAISKFSLGKNRKLVPASKMSAFNRALTTYVSRAFDDFSVQFRAKSIKVIDCRGRIVRTELHFLGARGNEPVHFRIKGRKITDIRVQNLWLAQQLRGYIGDELRKSGGDVDALIAAVNSWRQ